MGPEQALQLFRLAARHDVLHADLDTGDAAFVKCTGHAPALLGRTHQYGDIRATQRLATQLRIALLGEGEQGGDLVGCQTRGQVAHVRLRPRLSGNPREIADLERRASPSATVSPSIARLDSSMADSTGSKPMPDNANGQGWSNTAFTASVNAGTERKLRDRRSFASSAMASLVFR